MENDFLKVNYDEKMKRISARDLKDQNNLPAIYTTQKRNVKKVWDSFQSIFTPETTLDDLMNYLTDNNLQYHYWCMMD